jgi:hypothetical protein
MLVRIVLMTTLMATLMIGTKRIGQVSRPALLQQLQQANRQPGWLC